MSEVKVGARFGRLLVLEFVRQDEKSKLFLWKCRCDCGNEKVFKGSLMKRGITTSCGCYNKEVISKRVKTHGMTGTKFYGVWNTMVMRCHNPNSKSFVEYGERGITVCDRWRVFQNFYDDMFPKYRSGLSIERVDNSKGYSLDNCEWKTPMQQSNNTRRNRFVEYNGEKLTMSEMARRYNVPIDTFKRRLYAGWNVKDAIEKPRR